MESQEFQNMEDALRHLRTFEKRGFAQSVDLNFTIKYIDLKRPENKFSKEIILPHGRGKDIEVCIISEATGLGKREIDEMEKSKSKLKAFTKKYDFFLCEAPLMPVVGKVLGRYLAPKGKMPKLLPPGKDPAALIDETKKSVRIRLRDSPSIQIMIGTEAMTDEQLKENAEKVIEEVKKALPGKAQIKSIYLKFTMTRPVKLRV
jgi:large subunit ribosomal protein L1